MLVVFKAFLIIYALHNLTSVIIQLKEVYLTDEVSYLNSLLNLCF